MANFRGTPRINQDGTLSDQADYGQNTHNPNYTSDPANLDYEAGNPSWYDKLLQYGVPAAMAAIVGGPALFGGGGASGAGGVGADFLAGAPELGSTAPGVLAGTNLGAGGLSALPAATGAGMNFSSMFKQFDPTTLLLGGLSLFGKDPDPFQKKQSYAGSGSVTDPKDALYRALSATYRLGEGLSNRKPTQLRSPGPAPVQIPGLPFQIGGGLGTDPQMVHNLSDVFQFDPFQSVPQQEQSNPKGRI